MAVHWLQFSTTTCSLIKSLQWFHRPCSAPLWIDRVGKKPSVKADLAIYSYVIGCVWVVGKCSYKAKGFHFLCDLEWFLQIQSTKQKSFVGFTFTSASAHYSCGVIEYHIIIIMAKNFHNWNQK